jgi:hypothetical protein
MDPLTILSVAETLRGATRKQGVLGMFELIGVKNLLALVGLVVVGFATAGWYLGWYNIGTEKDAQGNTHVDLKVDPAKVKHDVNEGAVKVENAIEHKATSAMPTPVSGPVQPPAPLLAPPAIPGPPPGQPVSNLNPEARPQTPPAPPSGGWMLQITPPGPPQVPQPPVSLQPGQAGSTYWGAPNSPQPPQSPVSSQSQPPSQPKFEFYVGGPPK